MKPQKFWTLVYAVGGDILPYFLDRMDIVDDDYPTMESATFLALLTTKKQAQLAGEELDGDNNHYNLMPAPVTVEVKTDRDGKPLMTITMPISEALHKKLSSIKSSL